MAEKLAKWASNRGLISKLRPLDGCKGDTIPSTVVRGMISANLEVIWAMSAQWVGTPGVQAWAYPCGP